MNSEWMKELRPASRMLVEESQGKLRHSKPNEATSPPITTIEFEGSQLEWIELARLGLGLQPMCNEYQLMVVSHDGEVVYTLRCVACN